MPFHTRRRYLKVDILPRKGEFESCLNAPMDLGTIIHADSLFFIHNNTGLHASMVTRHSNLDYP
jgi:hypothetical protein